MVLDGNRCLCEGMKNAGTGKCTKIYKHVLISCLFYKDLLYSTGNSSQYSVMTYMGKESKKEWVYV